MGHGLEPVLGEETMGLLGVMKEAKEDGALDLVLVLAEGVNNGCELIVYLAIEIMNQSVSYSHNSH